MGNMTAQNFVDELVFDLRNRTDRTAVEGVSDERLMMWIGAGYLHVTHPSVFRHRELMFNYTIQLVNGQHRYTFSPAPTVAVLPITALRYVTHVSAATDTPTAQRTKLIPRDEQWFQGRTYTSGAPREYYIQGNSLIVGPVPGSEEVGQVLAVGAFREPTVLNLLTEAVTELPILWDEIILLASRWRAELHLGYRDLAESTKLDFVSLINEYKEFEQLHGEDWDWSSPVVTDGYMEQA